mgnify:CR=1 FL=1
MNLAKYSLDNTKIIYFFLAVLLIGGITSFGKLGKKEDAPFVIKSAVIMTRYPGAEPAEVERLITEPISREIQSMSGVYKIKSESMYGLSKITFELQPSLSASSIPQKWDELRRKVLNIQPQLPSGASTPTVSDDFGDVFGIYYGLTADDGFPYEEMRNWAERIKTQVVTADGVMKVALFGTQTEVVNIFISTNKLVGMGIDPKQLASLLQSQNQIINTGEIRAGEQQLRVTANGMYTTVDDIRNQVITTKAGQVKLGDIAVIEKGYLDPPSNIMHVNGKRAIGIGVSTDPQRDVVQTGENVKVKLNELLPLMPVGLELQSLYLENEIANEANNGFIINLIESILIVIVIIMLVMGLRAGLLIGSSLIFSIGGTLLIMSFFGVGLNRTSLAGFIIAMGMLVDNAIVVTDNAQIAIARGVNRRKALIDGATGPQWGLLGATFIAICSFLPLYLAPSAVAEIVKPLFVVLAISLGLSWVLALTQTTVFGNFILKAKTGDSTKDPYDKPFYHKFAFVLGVLIRKKAVTLVSMVILFIISLIIMGTMPQNFFPSLDKPYFRADVFYPGGYSINDVVKEMKSVEEHLAKQPEVKKVSITFGSTPLRYYLASTSVGPKPNFANVLVELTDSKYTKEYEEDFDGYMKANYPSAITRTSLFKLSPAVDAAIEIGFIGPNVDTLVSLTNQAIAIMHQNPDLINIRNSWGNKIPVWKPVYSPERAQPLGVSRQGMAQSIQIGTTGMTLGEYRQGDQVLPILLKNNQLDSFRINDLRTLPVFGTGNETTSLEQVVSEAVRFASQYKDQKVVIANQSGSLIYASSSLTDQRAEELITDPFTTYKIVSYDGHKYFAVKGTLPHYQYSYVTLAPFDEVAGALTVSMQTTFMIFLVGILFIWYLSSRLIRGIIRQFDALIQKMKLFTQNELELEPEEEDYGSQPNEIGALHHQFHQMALRIQNLVKVNYVNEILAKDAQLKALRSQISPHFLYNTLETINWRAKAMGNEVISQMVESLGNLLRVSLSSQKTLVTLAYELELVDSYITIQKIRFEERWSLR